MEETDSVAALVINKCKKIKCAGQKKRKKKRKRKENKEKRVCWSVIFGSHSMHRAINKGPHFVSALYTWYKRYYLNCFSHFLWNISWWNKAVGKFQAQNIYDIYNKCNHRSPKFMFYDFTKELHQDKINIFTTKCQHENKRHELTCRCRWNKYNVYWSVTCNVMACSHKVPKKTDQ